ncbi:hypothetical protein NFO65_18465 [Neorhizobium galegae]|uniref:hypothetical protein n=1 Tax=Neorhizobium galegae TaxID=399 RepID=UPI00210096A7|nr:hypothetical protein [Neorhizobium galegae]MCQ1572716.1 hypothetical protein [Neorhizobium galegae]
MRMRCLPLSLFFLLGCIASPAIAQPIACLTKTDDGGLKDGVGDVRTAKKEFYEASKVFPVKTFSDQAPTGKTAEFCLRYEIENIGQDHIQNLYWGLPGIYVKDFRPGAAERQSRSQQILSTSDPEVKPTLLNAFANNRAQSEAWRVDTQTAQATTKTQYAEVVPVDRNRLLSPEVQNILARNSVVQQGPLLVLNVGEDKQPYPLRETLSGPGFNLVVNSAVVRDGNSVRFQADVSLSGEGARNSTIFMPSLLALASIKSAGQPQYYRDYLATIQNLQNEGISGFSERRFSATLDRRDLLEGSVFLVDHVITVKANDNEYCYRVRSYMPFAVDFGLERCGR